MPPLKTAIPHSSLPLWATSPSAKGMTELAPQAGVTREALYKALSPNGDPRLSTFLGVIKAVGIKLRPHAA